MRVKKKIGERRAALKKQRKKLADARRKTALGLDKVSPARWDRMERSSKDRVARKAQQAGQTLGKGSAIDKLIALQRPVAEAITSFKEGATGGVMPKTILKNISKRAAILQKMVDRKVKVNPARFKPFMEYEVNIARTILHAATKQPEDFSMDDLMAARNISTLSQQVIRQMPRAVTEPSAQEVDNARRNLGLKQEGGFVETVPGRSKQVFSELSTLRSRDYRSMMLNTDARGRKDPTKVPLPLSKDLMQYSGPQPLPYTGLESLNPKNIDKRRKLSPKLSAVTDILKGTNYAGNPIKAVRASNNIMEATKKAKKISNEMAEAKRVLSETSQQMYAAAAEKSRWERQVELAANAKNPNAAAVKSLTKLHRKSVSKFAALQERTRKQIHKVNELRQGLDHANTMSSQGYYDVELANRERKQVPVAVIRGLIQNIQRLKQTAAQGQTALTGSVATAVLEKADLAKEEDAQRAAALRARKEKRLARKQDTPALARKAKREAKQHESDWKKYLLNQYTRLDKQKKSFTRTKRGAFVRKSVKGKKVYKKKK